MSNAETVQQIYDAFLRGDVPDILDRLADDVEWEYGAGETDVPWYQTRHGRAGASEFFASLSGAEFLRFEVKAILEKDNLVLALFDIEVIVKATGKKIVEEDEVHIWHFDDEGRVKRFRHRLDTLQQQEAVTGVAEVVA